MTKRIRDSRLISPQCITLTPVETVHQNPWFSVRNRGGYFTTEYKLPQIIILPIVEDHSIVMVRVKRPVLADCSLELPAGSAIENELPVAAATREFFEETGILIRDPNRFIEQHPVSGCPNRVPTLIHIFHILISNIEYECRKSHDHEILSVEKYGFDELIQKLNHGEIYIAAAMAIIGRYLLNEGLNS